MQATVKIESNIKINTSYHKIPLQKQLTRRNDINTKIHNPQNKNTYRVRQDKKTEPGQRVTHDKEKNIFPVNRKIKFETLPKRNTIYSQNVE